MVATASCAPYTLSSITPGTRARCAITEGEPPREVDCLWQRTMYIHITVASTIPWRLQSWPRNLLASPQPQGQSCDTCYLLCLSRVVFNVKLPGMRTMRAVVEKHCLLGRPNPFLLKHSASSFFTWALSSVTSLGGTTVEAC